MDWWPPESLAILRESGFEVPQSPPDSELESRTRRPCMLFEDSWWPGIAGHGMVWVREEIGKRIWTSAEIREKLGDRLEFWELPMTGLTFSYLVTPA